MLEIAGARAPDADIVRLRRDPAAVRATTRSSESSPATSTATSRSRSGWLSSPRLAGSRGELVVVDSSAAHSPVAEEWQPRVLKDGSRWEVYKRFFTGEGLAAELGGGEVLHEGRWFVVVRAPA